MVQQSLVEYIQRLLQQGYDAGAIRSTLINAGYSPYDVEIAMRAAGGSGRRINTKTLVVVFVLLLVLCAGVLVGLKLLQAEPVVLSFSVGLFSSEVAPGQDLIANVEVQNPSGRSTSGLVDLSVSGPSGVVVSKTVSFDVVSRASVPVTLSLPSSVVAGPYLLRVVLSYRGKSLSDSVSFDVVERLEVPAPVEVLEKPSEEQAREIQLTCPGGCDDLNFCTSDSCVQGSCVYSPVVPCCGNAVCESGENCPIDCSARPVNPDDVRASARELAVSDVSSAKSACDGLVQRVFVDACLSDVAEVSGSKDICKDVVDADVRDACLIPFAYKNDFSVCADLTNSYMKNSCFSLSELSKLQS